LRALLGCGLLLLAACQAREEPEQAGAQAGAQPADDNIIECALDGASEFKRVCEVEKGEADGGKVLTVRHPDGGFRRFDVLTDGHGLAAADGADEAKLTVEGDKLAVTVDNDRYRFPVTLKSDDPAK
jgi:hypothetical protein